MDLCPLNDHMISHPVWRAPISALPDGMAPKMQTQDNKRAINQNFHENTSFRLIYDIVYANLSANAVQSDSSFLVW